METYLLLYKYQQTTSYKLFSSLKILQQFQRKNLSKCADSIVCLYCKDTYVPMYKSCVQYRRMDITINRTMELYNRYQFLKLLLPPFVALKVKLW